MASRYKLLNNVLGWIIFSIAAFTFCSTIEPTTSFWDCGEYIACSAKLEVGHPPGAPTFLLIGRFFSLFASDTGQIAMMINLASALASAFTILFMFWTLTMLGRKLVKQIYPHEGNQVSETSMWMIFVSAIVGSLAYTFSDSFWFSAVEGEVYAMSSFFTALVFWAILKWDADDSGKADKWIVFIAYMMGLSIGVHLLNLLAIPAIVMIVYFKRYQVTRRGLITAGLMALFVLGAVQNGIIPGIVSAAANYELFFVNTIGLPTNFGTIIYFALLIGLIVTGLMYTTRGGESAFMRFVYVGGAFFLFVLLGAAFYGKFLMPFLTVAIVGYLVYKLKSNRAVLNTILLSFTVLLIGYSSFFILVIRSQANTPMDENNPENAISLLSYLNREQYGDWPIAYGPYFNAPLRADEDYADDGNPVWALDENTGEYVIIDARKQTEYKFAREMSTIFPRMWEMNQSSHVQPYKDWGDIDRNHTKVKLLDPQTGETKTYERPTMYSNLKYFFSYQLGHMYWRYFKWNFVGKQNDIQGHGNVTDGRAQSGIAALDPVDMSKAPKRLRENAANNKFYYLPFLLGIIGLFFHFYKDWRNALVVMLMFFFTGIAIVVYLNQYPLQPRERDYAYSGSFFAYAFWIGIGAFAVAHLVRMLMRKGTNPLEANSQPTGGSAMVPAAAGLLICVWVPYIMAQQGWDDHNRSERYTARDFAGNYLATCAENAILFTNGDNDTFPLWYEQEVEDYRSDVRVLNLSLLNTDWYIDQASRKAYESDAVPFSLPRAKYRSGSCDQVFFDRSKMATAPAMSARQLMDLIIKGDKSVTQLRYRKDDNDEPYTDTMYMLPTNKVYITVNKEECRKNGAVLPGTPDSLIADTLSWTINKPYLLKADLMILDLLATFNWERPVYFAVTAGGDSYLNLDDWFRLEGLAYRLVPMKGTQRGLFGEQVGCNTDIMYDNIMTKFRWGGLDAPGAKMYMDENNLRFTTNQRLQMMSLAKLLNEEGKAERATAVLDRMQTVMPSTVVPLEPAMVYAVENYYKAGATEKANKLSSELFAVCEEEYIFFSGVAQKTRDQSYENDLGRLSSCITMLYQYSQTYGQGELEQQYGSRMGAMQLPVPPKQPAFEPEPQMPDNMDSIMKAMEALRDSTDPNNIK
jgi:MFS family permease